MLTITGLLIRVHSKKYFLISRLKHMLWVLKGIVSAFEHPIEMFELMDKTIITILCLIFSFI